MVAAVNRAAQALALTALGGVALRVGWTDEHLRYVQEWMRWPLLISGALLVALAFTVVLGKRHAEGEPTSRAAWALVIPVAVAFIVQPPALGAYTADRGVNKIPDGAEPAVAGFAEDEVNDVEVAQFVVMAASHGEELAGVSVRMTGFVTSDADGWFVNRVSIRCCAADAAAFQVRIDGLEAPPDEEWVEVIGTWQEGTGTSYDVDDPPVLLAEELTEVDEPRNVYE